tara:strand:+ start:165 stop:851 length:687 start_codon:yes stop_codon:yes gene_type:complete
MSSKKIIVALDGSNLTKIKKIVNDLKSEAHSFKIGYEFFFNHGILGYNQIKKISSKIFLDLKLHDIPNTVEKGILAIERLKPILTTIHISGGNEMMRVSTLNRKYTKILGVSILTSLNRHQIRKFYNEENIEILIKQFSKEAKKQKLDGIVCSPKEIKIVRKVVGKNFLIVTPGIRPQKLKKINDDQKRVLTPSQAIKMGADLLVIGRPITLSHNPIKTLKDINNSLD